MHINSAFLILNSAFLILAAGCTSNNEKPNPIAADSLKNHMIAVNKILVDNEAERIDEFIKRHQWKMDSTGSGVRYWIYKKGNGAVPKTNDKVKLNYKLYLLDGTLVKQSEKDKPTEITLGQGESTTGLEEALMTMNSGSKAWLIVPKYLGYGMTGDQDKIPGNSTLLYDVGLVSVN